MYGLFESALKKYFNITISQELKSHVIQASHEYLIKNLQKTQVYLAKTNGGRCFNNRPLNVSLTDVIVDVDIVGCYGKGLRLQEYPLVITVIIYYL